MALGYLMIFIVGLLVVGILLQLFLYRKDTDLLAFLNTIYGLLLSYVIYTSQPSNYTLARLLALMWGILGLMGSYIYFKLNKNYGKIILSLAILAGLVQLLIF